MHPNRKDAITHEQARKSLQRFVNLHFKNVGEKSRASIPAHQDDDDILLSDYISQQELGPGLGSGALREALATYLLNTSPPDWEYDKVISMAAESLSLSRPIEPEAQYDALTLMQAVRRRVEKYQWDSGDANQEATSIANDIIGVVKRALTPSRQGAAKRVEG